MNRKNHFVTDSNVNLDARAAYKNALDDSSPSQAPPPSKQDGLSLFTKLCFSIAGLSYQIHFCALGVFTTVFLLNKANLPPSKNMFSNIENKLSKIYLNLMVRI